MTADGRPLEAALDVHTHAMPMPLLERLQSEGLADLREVDPDAPSGIVRLDPRISGVGPGAPVPLSRSQWALEARLDAMDEQGVSHHAVSLPPFLLASTCEDAGLASAIVSAGNDALADFTAQAPDRLIALGAVPVGTGDAAAEAQRCLDRGMAGLAIGTRGAGRELDDDINAPLWQLLHDRDVFTLLHPSAVPDIHRLGDYYLPQLVGYPMETAIAVSRLVFASVLERTPFPLCLAHGGGCLPWLRGRLDLGWERKNVAHTTPFPPSSYVRDLYVDSAVFSTDVLGHLVDDWGAGRVLMGSDFPFELADRDPLATIASLDVGADDQASIWRSNAARLLGVGA